MSPVLLIFRSLIVVLLFGITQAKAQSKDSCTFSTCSVQLKTGSIFLSKAGKATLDSLATRLDTSAACRIVVESHGNSREADLQLTWDKTVTVINYLAAKGLARERFVFMYGSEGEESVVTVSVFTAEGPSWVPAPIPCLSYHKLTKRRCKNFH